MEVRWILATLFTTTLLAFPLGLHSTHASANVPVRAPKTARGAATVRHRRSSHASISSFDLCVAGHESGAGEVVTVANARSYAHDIDWHMVDPPYSGAYQWDASTWLAAGGGRFGTASSATPEQQTIVFEHWESHDPTAWPVSVPDCGGP